MIIPWWTRVVVVTTVVILGLIDAWWAWGTAAAHDTITAVVSVWTHHHPWLLLLVGLGAGHLFIPPEDGWMPVLHVHRLVTKLEELGLEDHPELAPLLGQVRADMRAAPPE